MKTILLALLVFLMMGMYVGEVGRTMEWIVQTECPSGHSCYNQVGRLVGHSREVEPCDCSDHGILGKTVFESYDAYLLYRIERLEEAMDDVVESMQIINDRTPSLPGCGFADHDRSKKKC